MKQTIRSFGLLLILIPLALESKQIFYEHTCAPSYYIEHSPSLLWSNYTQQLDIINPNLFGTRLQRSTFYNSTLINKDAAAYFGMFNQSRKKIESFIGIDQDNPEELLSSMDIIHDVDHALVWPQGYGLKEQLSLHPEQRVFGFKIDITQGFDALNDRIQIRISIPVVVTRTYLNPTTNPRLSSSIDVPETQQNATLLDYLKGEIRNPSARNKQDGLAKLKFSSKPIERKGLSDIECAVRYRFWEKNGNYASASIKALIPCAKEPRGEFLYEPLVGNGGHAGLGLDGSLDLLLWASKNDASIELIVYGNYYHLFSSNQTRTPLFKNAQGEIVPWGPYQLAGTVGQRGLTPLANILSRPYKIEPGSRTECAASIIYHNQGFIGEFGLSCWARSSEKASIIQWDDNTYGVAKWSYNTQAVFSELDAFSAYKDGNNAPSKLRLINAQNIDLNSIQMPNTLAGQYSFAVGYISTHYKYPLAFSAGLIREFSHTTNAFAANWTAWIKLGINF